MSVMGVALLMIASFLCGLIIAIVVTVALLRGAVTLPW